MTGNLVKNTKSLCPQCLKKIDARLVEKNGKILIQKECPEHGKFEDVYYGDAVLYQQFMKEFHTGEGVENPITESTGNCPFDCGLCDNHKTSTVLAVMDVTNDCNFRCPICFANAAQAGYKFEPGMEQIEKMLDVLREERPPCGAILFSGGEPTIREDLPEIVALAKIKGFKQLMIATNGKVLADDASKVQELREAGLSTIYLQFDGVTPEPYVVARGFNALPLKKQVIRNVRKFKDTPNIVLVPTVVKGVNDQQVGSIIRFAAENLDVVQGIDFQPVAFTGRISKEELKEKRITIPDTLELIEEQTGGQIKKEDFRTIPFIIPVLEFLKREDKNSFPELSTHPVCGVGTYVFKSGDKLIPLTKIINVNELVNTVEELENGDRKEIASKLVSRMHKIIKLDGLKDSKPLFELLKKAVTEGSFEAAAKFHRSGVLFIGSMHFMDPYNFDCERVERCCIHYVTPGGRIIPFCSYNNLHRQEVEKKFSKKPVKGLHSTPGCD
jgi:hypothetical protein